MGVPRLILDCDPGIDDAIALHVIAAAVRAGQLRLEGIVAAAGNSSLDATVRNAAFLRDRLGLDLPVYRGVERSVGVDAHDFHGTDGIGGCYEPGHRAPETGDGVAWMVERVRSAAASGERMTILAVGPLTNIAAARRIEPKLPELVERMVVMGGAFRERGNITPFAEFNFYADAEAAADVFETSMTVTVIPLDVTHQAVINRADVAALEAEAGAQTLPSRLLAASIDCHDVSDRGVDGCYMHDALAAAVVLRPEIITTTRARVRVTRSGAEAGRSIGVADSSGTAQIAESVDVDAARRMILGALTTRDGARSANAG